MQKINGKWLWPILAVPMALAASAANADPWLEKSATVGQSWDDIPFLGQPQRRTQRQPRSPETTRALETKREMQRELNRAPQANRAVNAPLAAINQTPTANVFPPPRPSVEARTAALQARDAEKELQRELRRVLPPPPPAVVPTSEALACAQRLAKIARYEPLPSRAGPNGCGATDLVRLESILMPDRTSVALKPAPQISCGMAEQVAEWVREDVGPAAADLGAPLISITDNDAYDCRPRNNIKGAQLSEHGKGNALDITAIRLRNGGMFNLTDQQVTKPFRERIRAAACGRFMTVLGPGSDAYHNDHVHLDMAERKRKAQICQWNIHETVVASRSEPQSPEPAAVASAPPARIAPPVTTTPPPSALREPQFVRSEPAPAAAPPAVASEPPKQLAAVPPVPAVVPTEPAVEPPSVADVSPPLPLRKPEALLARAQVQAQSDNVGRGWRWEPPRQRQYQQTAPVRRRWGP